MQLNKAKAQDLLDSGFWLQLIEAAKARAFKDWIQSVNTSGVFEDIQARIKFDGYIERALRKAAKGDEE